MKQEFNGLANRVTALEHKVADLATYIHSALDYVASDPQSSLTKSRVTLEKLIIKLYRHAMNCEPRRPMIGKMLADKAFTDHIPRRIVARMNAVRDMSNLGPHGEDVDLSDAMRVMRDLLDILEWYVLNFDPAMGAVAIKEPRNVVEILPQLKEKYPRYISPEITSVKFVQSKGRCYLETNTADLVAEYLHNETTRREDLAFIVGEDHDVLFDPKYPIVENARKFISEMDEISIINCTDLFPDDIAAEIYQTLKTTDEFQKE